MASLRGIAIVLLIGFALRVGFVAADDIRFHPDEALFSTFARRAALNGDWLLHGDLDKPPLSIYVSALSMTLFAVRPRDTVLDFTVRQGEFAARLPSLFASIITIAAIYAAGKRLYRRRRIGLLAALLVCTSQTAIVFSATAFTDGLMICAGALAVWAAVSGKWGWTGFWLGAAFACKQQGLFFLPLVMGMGWAVRVLSPRNITQMIIPLLGWGIALVAWDAARGQETGFVALAAANNNVLHFIHAYEFPSRLCLWVVLVWMLSGLIAGKVGNRLTERDLISRHDIRIGRVLWLYILAYVGLHIMVAFNIYDRYALPLLIPGAIVIARGLQLSIDYARRSHFGWFVWVVISGVMIVNVVFATNRASPIGGDGTFGRWGVYAGIDDLADYLNAKPVATVIYDRWLGWELGYYMGEWHDKRRVYFPTPEALAAGAAALHETEPRYFVAPRDKPLTLWLKALRDAGFAVILEYESDRFQAYRLEPPGQP